MSPGVSRGIPIRGPAHLGQLTDALLDPAWRSRCDAGSRPCSPPARRARRRGTDPAGSRTVASRRALSARHGRSRACSPRHPVSRVDRIHPAMRCGARPRWADSLDSQRLLDRLAKRTRTASWTSSCATGLAAASSTRFTAALAGAASASCSRSRFADCTQAMQKLRGTGPRVPRDMLPPDLRERLWPLSGGRNGARAAAPRPPSRSREQVLNDLLRPTARSRWTRRFPAPARTARHRAPAGG